MRSTASFDRLPPSRPTPGRLAPDRLDDVRGGTAARPIDSFITGTPGDDSLVGSDDPEGIDGGEGNDTLAGGGGQDVLTGGAGNDLLSGGGGADQIFGGDGDDAMEGGYADGANDVVRGGAGNDGYLWQRGDGNDRFDGGEGRDTVTLIGISFEDLLAVLRAAGFDERKLVLDPGRSAVSFIDGMGTPTGTAGVLRFGEETLSFTNLERIQVWG